MNLKINTAICILLGLGSSDALSVSMRGDEPIVNKSGFYRPSDEDLVVQQQNESSTLPTTSTPSPTVATEEANNSHNDDEPNESLSDDGTQEPIQLPNCFARYNIKDHISNGVDIYLFDETTRIDYALKNKLAGMLNTQSKNKMILALSYNQTNVSVRFIGYNILDYKPDEKQVEQNSEPGLNPFDKCMFDNSRVFKSQFSLAVTAIPYSDEENINQLTSLTQMLEYLPSNSKQSFYWISSGFDIKVIDLISNGDVDYGAINQRDPNPISRHNVFNFHWVYAGNKYIPEYSKYPGLVSGFYKSFIERAGGKFSDERENNKSNRVEEKLR